MLAYAAIRHYEFVEEHELFYTEFLQLHESMILMNVNCNSMSNHCGPNLNWLRYKNVPSLNSNLTFYGYVEEKSRASIYARSISIFSQLVGKFIIEKYLNFILSKR